MNNKYDCIVGLSGGVDSCFTLHKAIEIGLKTFSGSYGQWMEF